MFFTANAQYKISGVVIDNETKEPIPYANISIPGTTVGTTTDEKGVFYLEHNEGQKDLVCSFIGYENLEISVQAKQVFGIIVQMKEQRLSIEGIVLDFGKKKRRKKKGDPAYELLQKIWKNKKFSAFDGVDYYEYDKYEKIEFDINNVDSSMIKSKLLKGMEFIFEKMDTSAITGKSFLPIFLNESILKVFGKNNPEKVNEKLIANKTSGFKENLAVINTAKNLYSENDIYDNYLEYFGKSFVSPIARNGWSVYNYYITDTIVENGRKYIQMNYFPRGDGDLTFKGGFSVDAEYFSIKKITMDVTRGININFVNDIYIENEFEILNDSVFLLTRDYVEADLKPFNNKEESKGMNAKRTTIFKNHIFDQPKDDEVYNEIVTELDHEIFEKSDEFWNKNRFEELNKNEEGIYETLDKLQQTKRFRLYVDLVTILESGYIYFEDLNFDFGSIYNIIGNNDVEGTRIRLGGRTYFGQNDSWRIQGYGAYGLKDKQFKYGIAGKILLEKKKRVIFGLGHTRDVFQLGGQLTVEDGVLSQAFGSSQVLTAGENVTLSSVNKTNAFLETEPLKNFKISLDATGSKIKSAAPELFSVEYIDPETGFVENDVTDFHGGIGIKYTPGRKEYGYGVERRSVHTFHPTLFLKYTQGFSGVFNSNFDYSKLQFYYKQPWLIGSIGRLISTLEAGKTFGDVSVSLLDIPPGNQTFFVINSTFAQLNFYEFITDEYLSFHLEHHFEGRIFGKIPLLKKLKLREVIFFRGLLGDVSQNNLDLRTENTINYNTPNNEMYYEYGFGIENIGFGNLRLFRLDFNWRGNYLENPNADRFGVKLGIGVNF